MSQHLPTEKYYSSLADALASEQTIFLKNPTWSQEQQLEAERQEQEISQNLCSCVTAKIFIPTGGSGGRIRFVAHTLETLTASARGLISFLEKEFSPRAGTLNCFACLPPWHISGVMPLVRSRISGGKLFVSEDRSFRAGKPLPNFRESANEFWMNSLVPTQLFRLLERPDGATWLREFDFVLLGGASVPAELLEHAQREKIRIGVGYGMTETASLVALGTAPDFLSGTVLPHAKILIGDGGRIQISAESLSPDCAKIFETNDEGFFDEAGKLHVVGRLDRFINSGGEKIDPSIIENAILKTGFATGTLVVGEANSEWGMRIVALLTGTPAEKFSALRDALTGTLPSLMIPKRFICVPALPFDEKGKLDRVELARFLKNF